MKLRRIQAVIRRHVYEAVRNPDRIAEVLFWPFLDVITWGFFSRYLVHGGRASFAGPEQLVGGIILWGAFRAYQRDVAVGFLSEIWSRNIGGLFASPLSLFEYVSALLLVDFAKLALALGLIVISCFILTNVPHLHLVLQLAVPLAILLIFGAAIGLFVTGLILRYSTRVQTLAYGIAGLLMPISCVFYPASALPPLLRGVALQLPTTQAFEAMRDYMEGGSPSFAALAGAVATALLALLAGTLFFRGVIKGARRSGRLVRLQ